MTYSLKSLMWRQLGIERRATSIEDAIERIDFWTRAVLQLAPPEPRSWELVNMLTISRLIAHSALAREESRGTHYRADFPATSDEWRAHTILAPKLENGTVIGLDLSREPVSETVGAG
jgi:L-aspartate oxidase